MTDMAVSLSVLYRDEDIVVCLKPPSLSSERIADGGDVLTVLERQLSVSSQRAVTLYPIHRLDLGVGGVMVFACHSKAAAAMSAQVAAREMQKEYLCVVAGCPEEAEGTYTDLLFKDAKRNKSFVTDRQRKGVKQASLSYTVCHQMVWEEQRLSLVSVRLHTGRSHQIRVQFSSRKMPLVGDGKYGSRIKGAIALWSCRLTFCHPRTGNVMTFFHAPNGDCFPWTVFQPIIKELS